MAEEKRIEDLGKAAFVGGQIAVNSVWGFAKALSILTVPLIITGVAAYSATWLISITMKILARGDNEAT